MRTLFVLVFAAATLLSSLAQAGGNLGVCIAIQQNFNNCAAQQQRQAERDQWEKWEDGPYYGRRHWRHRAIDCTPWIYALKANNCF
jgi:hypothetical protein